MDREKEIIQQWDEWLPPEPHRGRVVEFVARGRASIVQPDPDRPPMLMYEDGGSMSLPDVRCDGSEPFYSAQRPPTEDTGERRITKYSDVCGSVDEFKRHVADGPEALQEHREDIRELFDDIRYMIGRMYRRQREYTAFADRLRGIIEELEAVEIVDRTPSDEGLAEIERLLEADVPADAERLNELAEQVRAVASAQEGRLRDHKAAALRVLEAYRDVKGPRDWSEDEEGG
ncbi:MAG: hypothetical protein U9R79_03155 [Armatimonadota bacterium]|nr:hypothetical protein [Armatimonadota bacterium]